MGAKKKLASPPAVSDLRLHRLAEGFTLRKVRLAVGAGCSESVLSRLERGLIVRPYLERKVRAFLRGIRAARSA